MKQSRRKRATRRRRVKRGGANNAIVPIMDCDNEGFDLYMRFAALGIGYTVGVGDIHERGEQWSYEEAVHHTMGGMVDWYRRVLENPVVVDRQLRRDLELIPVPVRPYIPPQGRIDPIPPYTEAELVRLENNEDLKILAAFYSRYKIVLEKGPLAIRLFNGGIKAIYSNEVYLPDEYAGRGSYRRLQSQLEPTTPSGSFKITLGGGRELKFSKAAKKALDTLVNYEEMDFSMIDIPIQFVVDRVQCIIFSIVKHRGELPPGFQMDDRIRNRAHEVLKLEGISNILKGRHWGAATLITVEAWLTFLQQISAELLEPPVTFGLRWP